MSFDRSRLVRGVAVAVVALFLIAGAAFAGSGILTPLAGHGGTQDQGASRTQTDQPQTPDAADDQSGDQGQAESAETPDPAETPDSAEGQSGDQEQAGDDQGDQAESGEADDASDAPDATDDQGDPKGGDSKGGGSNGGGSDSGSDH